MSLGVGNIRWNEEFRKPEKSGSVKPEKSGPFCVWVCEGTWATSGEYKINTICPSTFQYHATEELALIEFEKMRSDYFYVFHFISF